MYKLRSLEANYDTMHKTWLVRNYVLREINGLHEKVTSGDSLRISIPLTMAEFGMKLKSMPAMTTPELDKFIESLEEEYLGSSKRPKINPKYTKLMNRNRKG